MPSQPCAALRRLRSPRFSKSQQDAFRLHAMQIVQLVEGAQMSKAPIQARQPRSNVQAYVFAMTPCSVSHADLQDKWQQIAACCDSCLGHKQDGTCVFHGADTPPTGVQAFADRLSAVFVPICIAAAFTTWLSWYLAGITGGGSTCAAFQPVCAI